jgi:AraC-binding-like domain
MIKLWSTAEVHLRDRLAYWVDAVCHTLVRVDCTPQRDRPFFGEIRADMTGDVLVCKASSTAQVITRSLRQIAREPRDDAPVCVQLAGRCIVSVDGRDLALRPGEFMVHDGSQPFQILFDGDFAQTILQVPRTALLRRLGAPRLRAVRFGGGPVGRRAFADVAKAAFAFGRNP